MIFSIEGKKKNLDGVFAKPQILSKPVTRERDFFSLCNFQFVNSPLMRGIMANYPRLRGEEKTTLPR